MDSIQEKYDLIESTVIYIRRLSSDIKKELPLYRSKGAININTVMEILEWLNDILKAVILTSNVSEIQSDDSVEKTKNCISEITEAITNRDVVYIADVLEYEILPVIEEWRKKLVNAYTLRSGVN